MPKSTGRNSGCLAIIGTFVLMIMLPASVPAIFIGAGEWWSASNTYVVGFANSGDDCGPNRVRIDIETGQPLSCAPVGLNPIATPVRFPGFTDAQNRAVAELARDLGSDGIDDGDRLEIQRLVDEYAAGVPDSQRPHDDDGLPLGPLRGARLFLLGVVMLAIPLTVALVRWLRKYRDSLGPPAPRPGDREEHQW